MLLDIFDGCNLVSLRLNDLNVLHLLGSRIRLLLLELLLVLSLLLGGSHIVSLDIDVLRLRVNQRLFGPEASGKSRWLRLEVLLLLGIGLQGMARGRGISSSVFVDLGNGRGDLVVGNMGVGGVLWLKGNILNGFLGIMRMVGVVDDRLMGKNLRLTVGDMLGLLEVLHGMVLGMMSRD